MVLLNPYHDLFRLVQAESPGPSVEFQLALRKKLIWAYSWAIPNDEAIWALAGLSPLIELGAGAGYWAWLLRQAGGEVAAFDLHPGAPPHWTEVSSGDETVVKRYPDRTLFLCWPSYQEPMAAKALGIFRGSRLAYVGEPRGRTADDDFHLALEKEFVLEREIRIPTWPGYRDRLFIYRRCHGPRPRGHIGND